MSTGLDLEPIADRHAFNLKCWAELCADPVLAALDHRIETDRFGHILMIPPPGFDHGHRQFEIGYHLRRLMPWGQVVTECPVSTSDGVKAADVIWISKERLETALQDRVLVIAPEICVEVLSPSNSRDEIDFKRDLYFDSGAEEVWVCDLEGQIICFLKESPDQRLHSKRCPDFPESV